MEINHHYCHDRSKLDHYIEHIFECIILLELNQFFHQDQMPGTADREPLRDSLHNTKNNYF